MSLESTFTESSQADDERDRPASDNGAPPGEHKVEGNEYSRDTEPSQPDNEREPSADDDKDGEDEIRNVCSLLRDFATSYIAFSACSLVGNR